MKTSISLRALTLAATLAGAAFGASAQTAAPARIGIAQLQAIYLRCADLSARSPLDSVDFAFCAAVGDDLRDRAFDGSFERLIAWWQSARTPVVVEAEPRDATDKGADTVSLQTMFGD